MKGDGPGFVWPGFGLVMGAGAGSVLGLLVASDVFYLFAGAGAGIGLVVGATIHSFATRAG